MSGHFLRIEHISTVEDQRMLDQSPNFGPVQGPEFIPLRDNQNRICPLGRLVSVTAIVNVRQNNLAFSFATGS